MDPFTITAATTVLLQLLKKGAEKFAEGIGQDSWAGVKKLFSGHHENSDQVLDDLKANPDDVELQVKFKKMFNEVVKAHSELLVQIEKSKPVKKITQNNQSGHNFVIDTLNGNLTIE